MKNNLRRTYVCSILIIIFAFGAGCNTYLQPNTEVTSVPKTQMSDIGTNASILTNSTNQISTETLKPTITIKPFTRTPSPTLSAERIKQLINDAKRTNLGCQLPCWWSIVPGETTWDVTHEFFSTLASDFERLYQHNGYHVKFPDPDSQGEMFGLYFFLTDAGLVDSMDVPSFKSLADMLRQFGKPEQIWFYSGGVSAYSLPPSFSLALFYPEHGLLFYYQDGIGEYSKDGKSLSIKICSKHFSDPVYPRFYLWNISNPKAFEQIKTYLFTVPEDWRFRPLKEVTNMDIPAFTKAFLSPNSKACFLSPADIWPFPLK